MAAPELLRRQISFGIAGVILGFLLGFVLSHQIYGGRSARTAAGGAPAALMGTGTAQGAGPMGSGGGPGSGESAPGMAGGGMEQVTQELNALRALLKEDPRNVQALSRMARLYMDAAMYDKALGYLETAVEESPQDVHLRTDMATSLLMTGRTQDALAEFQKCVERDPDHAKTWYSMGFAYVQIAEYDKAEQAFARALELSPGAFDMQALKAEIDRLKAQRGTRSGGAPS